MTSADTRQDEPTIDAPTRAFRTVESALLFVLIAWLFAGSLLVEVEYYDGYDSICNVRRVTGRSDTYVLNRNPMMMWLLIPAEFAHYAAGSHPMDPTPYHIEMAVLHSVYLLAIWWLMRRRFGANWPTLLAFAAAVPCFMFFEYAPFVSHDILPGVMLLGMLYCADSLSRRWSWRVWAVMIVLGAMAPLIKHVFALFWVFLLVASPLLMLPRKAPDRVAANDADDNETEGSDAPVPDRSDPTPLRFFGLLFLGATISGAITWLGIGFAQWAPGSDPMTVLRGPLSQFDVLGNTLTTFMGKALFPVWVYGRNALAYGLLAVLLILPGLVFAWRSGDRMLRAGAVMWVLFVVTMHLLSFREVRYLLYLTPLTAVLLVPIMRQIVQRRVLFGGAVALLIVGLLPGYPYSIVSNMLRITEPFYRQSELRAFLEPMEARRDKPVLAYTLMVSAVPPGETPIAGDRYNRAFHLSPMHIRLLFQYPKQNFGHFTRNSHAPEQINWPTGTTLITTPGGVLLNPVTPEGGPPVGRDVFMQLIARDHQLRLEPRGGGRYAMPDGSIVTLAARRLNNGPPRFTLQGDELKRYIEANHLYPLTLRLDMFGEGLPHVIQIEAEHLVVTTLSRLPPEGINRPIVIRGFAVERIMHYPDPQGTAQIVTNDMTGLVRHAGDELRAARESQTARETQRYEEAIRAAGEDRHAAHNNLGMIAMKRGDLDAAEKHFRDALEADPDYALAAFNLGHVALRRGDLDAAETWFRQATEDDPEHAASSYNLGTTLGRLNRFNEAIKPMERAVHLEPGNADFVRGLGKAYFGARRYEKAAAVFTHIVKTSKNDAEAHAQLGMALANLSRLEPAAEHLRTATRLAPSEAGYHRSLGMVLKAMGRTDESEAMLNKARQLQTETSSTPSPPAKSP